MFSRFPKYHSLNIHFLSLKCRVAKLLTISMFSWYGFRQLITPLWYSIYPYPHSKGAVFCKLVLLIILWWSVTSSENVLKKIFHIRILKICYCKSRVFDTQPPLMIDSSWFSGLNLQSNLLCQPFCKQQSVKTIYLSFWMLPACTIKYIFPR